MDPPTLDYGNTLPSSHTQFEYVNVDDQGSPPSGVAGGPFIPPSLKQPFKIPKRSSANSSSSTSGDNAAPSERRPVMKSNGHVSMKSKPTSSNNKPRSGNADRPPPRDGKKQGNSETGKRKNDGGGGGGGKDDDEELPEELQHLEKELVHKIQNEILDNGEAVTFDDIAGLDGAKQIISEVVCWPMKRPELFRGLRRASNGLLLYGPPG
jgi:hypothetical protein